MTNVAAKKMLVKHGILKAPKDKMYCWQCGSLMSYASSSSGQSSNAADTMQCANCTVAGRRKLQVKAVSLSYSPFWKTHRSGHEISYDLFLRTAFLHGIRTPVDAMQQLVPESGKHVTNQTVRKWVDHMNFCLAYSVMKMADKEVLKNELVEADGSGFSVLKKSGDVKHLKRTKPAKSEKGKAATKRFWNQKNEESRHGRFAVLRGRFTKKSILKPLPSRSVAKGSPGAGETVKEFSRVVKKHVDGSSVLACTDSGSAVVGAFSAIGVPTAAARHSLDEMTPTRTFKLSKLTKGQAKMIRKASVCKRPAAVLSPKKTVAKVLGGDNFSEAEFSRLKRSLRRVNKIGRMSPKRAHIDPLAMQALLDAPGLMTVLNAMSLYRQDRVHSLGANPMHFGDLVHDKSWLDV